MNVKILSGVSGSGKSTYAGVLLQKYVEECNMSLEERLRLPKGDMRGAGAVCSADTFFVGEDGSYNFDPRKLSDAHGACFRDYIDCVRRNVPFVIVDNTNTTAVEIAPYILGAQAHGYDVEIITILPTFPTTSPAVLNWKEDYAKVCAGRNRHGVGYETIRAQLNRIMARELMPWWKHTFIDPKV